MATIAIPKAPPSDAPAARIQSSSVRSESSSVRPDPEPNATLVGRRDLTPSIARFVIRPDDGVGPFAPGQYFALGLSGDARTLQRPYSTSSAPGSRTGLEFLIRLVSGGAFTPRFWGLRIGDRLRIGPAKGLFTLSPGDSRTHLFVATGTGLAPCVSMLESLVGNDAGEASETGGAPATTPRAIIVHGTSRVEELAYRDRLEDLATVNSGVHYVPVISRPMDPANARWAGLTGRVASELGQICDTHRLDPVTSVAYLCGNPEMITSARAILSEIGFAPEAVVSEQYWPPT